jgi:hypothetical protein
MELDSPIVRDPRIAQRRLLLQRLPRGMRPISGPKTGPAGRVWRQASFYCAGNTAMRAFCQGDADRGAAIPWCHLRRCNSGSCGNPMTSSLDGRGCFAFGPGAGFPSLRKLRCDTTRGRLATQGLNQGFPASPSGLPAVPAAPLAGSSCICARSAGRPRLSRVA